LIILQSFSFQTTLKKSFSENLYDWIGIFKYNHYLTIILTIFIFSLAGVPPMLGYFSKLQALTMAYTIKYYPIVILMVISTLISTFYYLRLINYLYFYGEFITHRYYKPINYVVALILFGLAFICLTFVLHSDYNPIVQI